MRRNVCEMCSSSMAAVAAVPFVGSLMEGSQLNGLWIMATHITHYARTGTHQKTKNHQEEKKSDRQTTHTKHKRDREQDMGVVHARTSLHRRRGTLFLQALVPIHNPSHTYPLLYGRALSSAGTWVVALVRDRIGSGGYSSYRGGPSGDERVKLPADIVQN